MATGKRQRRGGNVIPGLRGHASEHGLFDATNPERYRASRRVTLVSILTNACLSTAQIMLGHIGHSQALVADGVHTLSDLITDLMVLLAVREGAKAADPEHPYGHGRIETAVTVLLGLMLIAVAIGISVNAGLRLADLGALPTPSALTLIVALVTILAKESLYRYTIATARTYHSNLLRANAWHHRSDAISSVIVLIGIAGALAGFTYLDALAAIGVAMMVAKIGWDLGWNAVKELIDTGLEQDEVAAIRAAIMKIDGVKSLHLLRTRQMGGRALVDVHILVDGRISVSEGHHISETVCGRLLEQFEPVADVTVHIDPEDDENIDPNLGLPPRQTLLRQLKAELSDIPQAELIEQVTLHYLAGKISVELHLPDHAAPDRQDRQALVEKLRKAGTALPHLSQVEILFRAP